jgi:two-component system sensor histidine kinase KdpD
MNNDEKNRPSPDALLKEIRKVEKNSTRGRLRVFFGMCPGVGKTYAMLKSAHEQKRMGLRVLIGVVETHGRIETESLTKDLELLPKKNVAYKGADLAEMDLDAILLAKPNLVLVDELAHTNAPGSRHPKRYQDVEEILAAGIDVFTTVNVQHIESRADVVEQITGVPVRETVPDSFLELAQQIELVDLTPEELLKRLKEGKVYLGERAERAQQNFFKTEHLTALREIALRFTADLVDHELQSHRALQQIRGTWNTNERLLVAVSGSPLSARLIRAARRMAYQMEAPWVALHIETGSELSAKQQESLHKNIALAKELGAEIITTQDDSIPLAITRIAEQKNVTQIIVGRPIRRFFSDRIHGGTLLDRLIREASGIDVHVIRQENSVNKFSLPIKFPHLQSGFRNYWNTFWFLIGVTFLSSLLNPAIGYHSVGFIYLVAVMVLSLFSSRGPLLFGSFFSALVWNYFFIPPLFTFAINSSEDAMMCITFFLVAMIAGTLAARIRQKDQALLQRETRSNLLYELGRDLNESASEREIAFTVTRVIRNLFKGDCLILKQVGHDLDPHPLFKTDTVLDNKDYSVASWAIKNHQKAGIGTHTLSSSRALCIPLQGKSHAVGVLLFYPRLDPKTITAFSLPLDLENLLDTIATHLANSLERELFEKQMRKTSLLEESEKLHQTLLNSVSHELRTPLTSIIGTASALQDPVAGALEKSRLALTDELIASSRRLNRVVENLLDMSRLNTGFLQIKNEMIEINDLIRQTTQHLARDLSEHHLLLKLSATDLFCTGDYRLLEHALINLVVNAIHYSPVGSSITIQTDSFAQQIRIQVIDEGPGIPVESLAKLFDKFYRVPGSPAGGTGLGLSIVQGIMESHQGHIQVQNRLDRTGSCFTLLLKASALQGKLE